MSLDVVNNLVNCTECHGYACIGTAVVDCDSACINVTESCAGEGNVLNVADAFVVFSGVKEIFAAAVLNDPGLIDIEDACAEAVNETVAAFENAVIEYEPAFACFDRDRTCADLLGFPALHGSHNVSVLAPVGHVLGVREIHIAEGCMTAVRRTGEHYIFAVYLSGEENAVSVEGEECVFTLVEFLEILCPAHADCRLPAVSVTPCDPETVFDPYTSGVVAVLPGISFSSGRIVVYPVNSLFVDIPVDTVLGEACVDSHISFLIVNSEHACELIVAVLEGNYCAVEDGVACGEKVSRNYRVSVIAPDNILTACGLVLPGDVGERGLIKNFNVHDKYLFLFIIRCVKLRAPFLTVA